MQLGTLQETLAFNPISAEEKLNRGILGTLYGPIASVVQPTRNGRKYSEKLWDKVFTNPLVLEMIKNGGCPGELDHPADRLETSSDRIAIMMPDVPKKDKDGHLIAKFDIIDTPCGKIAYALARYGFKFGISSRGDGEIETDYDGNESVDPDSYDFKAFDLVLLPACADARLQLQESKRCGKTLNETLNLLLSKSTEEDKQLMLETLSKLDIDFKEDNVDIESVSSEEKVEEAVDDGLTAILDELQEQIKSNKTLTEDLKTVQEQLSVCNAKEADYEEELTALRNEVTGLNERLAEAKEQSDVVCTLTEELDSTKKLVARLRSKVASLSQQLVESKKENSKQLTESLSTKDSEVKKLEESFEAYKVDADKQKSELLEKLETLKKDSQIKTNEFNTKAKKFVGIIEHYKNEAKESKSRYVELKAMTLGIKPEVVKARLNEDYTFEDVDAACEGIQCYNVTASKLPFSNTTRVKVTESIEPIKGKNRYDDEVDDSLLRIAGLL